jgi:hypothetical protein
MNPIAIILTRASITNRIVNIRLNISISLIKLLLGSNKGFSITNIIDDNTISTSIILSNIYDLLHLFYIYDLYEVNSNYFYNNVFDGFNLLATENY